jgi:MFS family permease
LQTAYWSLVLFSVLFAIGIAGINSLTTPYLVELIGKEKFANATGIISLFRGFGCFIGPFLAGMKKKLYKIL